MQMILCMLLIVFLNSLHVLTPPFIFPRLVLEKGNGKEMLCGWVSIHSPRTGGLRYALQKAVCRSRLHLQSRSERCMLDACFIYRVQKRWLRNKSQNDRRQLRQARGRSVRMRCSRLHRPIGCGQACLHQARWSRNLQCIRVPKKRQRERRLQPSRHRRDGARR